MIKDVLARIVDGETLDREEARSVMQLIMRGEATPAQIAGFLVPPLETVQGYGKSVRKHTLEFLRQLPAEKLDDKPRPDRSEQTIVDTFQRVILELTLHIGQITYLRGMQRGLDK